MAVIEPYECKGEAIEMTLTGKELAEMINKNPDIEFVVSFDFRTPSTKKGWHCKKPWPTSRINSSRAN